MLRLRYCAILFFYLATGLGTTNSAHGMEDVAWKQRALEVCSWYSPPTLLLTLKMFPSAVLAWNFYVSIRDKNLFRGNLLSVTDLKAMGFGMHAALLAVIFEKSFVRYCEALLYSKRANLSSEEAEDIKFYALQLAIIDSILCVGFVVQHSNTIWHCVKGLHCKKAEKIEDVCSICRQNPIDAVSPCSFSKKHIFCKKCIEESFIFNKSCPLCRTVLVQKFPSSLKEVARRVGAINSKGKLFLTYSTAMMLFFIYYFYLQQNRITWLNTRQ